MRFTGTVISHPTRFDNGAGACLVRLTRQDDAPLGESVVVNLKGSKEVFDRLTDAGIGKAARIAFEADGWILHQPGVDRVLPARGTYSETLIHRLDGLKPESIEVLAWVKRGNTLSEAAEGLIEKAMSAFSRKHQVEA
jgi:hypothetical protein